MTTSAAGKREPLSGSAGCGGDGCGSRDPWPLHHVRHRSVYCRLCTSCVLRYHPGAFCCACFDVLDSPPHPDRPLAHCDKCPAVAHLACLPDPVAAHYLCPSCSNPHDFSYFPADSSPNNPTDDPLFPDGRHWAIDLPSAKVLFAAARLASASMTRAAAAARAEAERKVREAALAKKRAREMLERALSVSKKEREKAKEFVSTAAVTPSAANAIELKKKPLRMDGAVPAVVTLPVQKTAQDRNREKWRRFHEPIQVVHAPLPAQSIVENDMNKGHPINSIQNHVSSDVKDQMESLSHIVNNAKQGECEEETKGLLPNSQVVAGVKEGRRSTVEPEKGLRMLQQTQDVSRTSNGAILTGPPNTASLLS